jgi:regulator of replication initiation timing
VSILNLLTEVPLSAVLREKIVGLESENESLRLENESLKVELSQSEEQRRTLEKQVAEHVQSLTFDKSTGVWEDDTKSLHYCPKCKSSGTLSPMKEEPHGWYCAVCNTTFPDPNRPKPQAPRPPPNWRAS